MASYRPTSAVPSRTVLLGVLGALIGCLSAVLLDLPAGLEAFVFLGCCAGPMWCSELKRFPRPPLGASGVLKDWRRHYRVVGVASVSGLFLATISVFVTFAADAISGLIRQALLLIPLVVIWLLWVISRAPSSPTLSSVERLGLAVSRLLRRRSLRANDWGVGRAWLVKAFFLPLMISSVYLFLNSATSYVEDGWTIWAVFYAIYTLMFAIDTAFATIGYCSTSRRIGAHIRSTEPTMLGWVAALVCYPPFNAVILHQWLNYHDGYKWSDWLAGNDVLLVAWGVAILLSVGLYVAATVSFGPRFSNLTNRGIITSGPYRLFKHPSYVGKNVAWWLISIPFISHAGYEHALLNCAALFAINSIYVVRAKTEERHLLADPDYQRYVAWIDEFGVLSRMWKLMRRLSIVPARGS